MILVSFLAFNFMRENIYFKPFFSALIHLPRKIQFTEYVKPVKMPNECKSTENIDVLTMGNGATSDSTSLSTKLNFAFLKTISPSECHSTFPISSKRKTIICAQNTINDQSICRGDSGAPLVTRSDGILIGVSSFVHKGKKDKRL